MIVRTLLQGKPREVITTSSSTSIDEAMSLLISNEISCLPVVDDSGKLIGIVSDKDIFKNIYKAKADYQRLKVKDMMTTDLVIGLPDDDITYIAAVMAARWLRHVPIVEGDRLLGLISMWDIIKEQAKDMEIQSRYLDMYMNMQQDKSGEA